MYTGPGGGGAGVPQGRGRGSTGGHEAPQQAQTLLQRLPEKVSL